MLVMVPNPIGECVPKKKDGKRERWNVFLGGGDALQRPVHIHDVLPSEHKQ